MKKSFAPVVARPESQPFRLQVPEACQYSGSLLVFPSVGLVSSVRHKFRFEFGTEGALKRQTDRRVNPAEFAGLFEVCHFEFALDRQLGLRGNLHTRFYSLAHGRIEDGLDNRAFTVVVGHLEFNSRDGFPFQDIAELFQTIEYSLLYFHLGLSLRFESLYGFNSFCQNVRAEICHFG